MTGRVKDMIMDPTQTGRLHEVIAEGGYYGMQTFDQAPVRAPARPAASRWTRRCQAASSPHDFKLLMASDGRRGTTMDDLAQAETERSEPRRGPVRALSPVPRPGAC